MATIASLFTKRALNKSQVTPGRYEPVTVEVDPRTGLKTVAVPERLKTAFKDLDNGVLHYFEPVEKINKKGKPQDRVMVISHNVLYLCQDNGNVKRCIPIKNIGEVLVDKDNGTVALKVPTDYDCYFRPKDPGQMDEIIDILQKCHHFLQEEPLKVNPNSLTTDSIGTLLQLEKPKTGFDIQMHPVPVSEDIQLWQIQRDALTSRDEKISGLTATLEDLQRKLAQFRKNNGELEERAKLLDSDLENTRHKLEETSSEFQSYQRFATSKIDELSNKYSKTLEDLIATKRLLETTTADLNKLVAEHATQNQRNGVLEVENAKLTASNATLSRQHEEDIAKLKKLNTDHDALLKAKAATDQELASLKEKMDADEKYHRQLAEEFEACKAELRERVRNIEFHKLREQKLEAQLFTLQHDVRDYQQRCDELSVKYEASQNERDRLQSEAQKWQKEAQILREQWETLHDEALSASQLVQLRHQVVVLQTQLTKRGTDYDTLLADYETCKADRDRTQEDLRVFLDSEDDRSTWKVQVEELRQELIDAVKIISEQICQFCRRKLEVNGDDGSPVTHALVSQEAELLKDLPKNFKHLCKGRYQFGTSNICVSHIEDQVVVRQGGGYLLFKDFVNRFGPEEAAKMRNVVLSETQHRLDLEEERDTHDVSLTPQTARNYFGPGSPVLSPLRRPSEGHSASPHGSIGTRGSPVTTAPTLVQPQASNTRQVLPTVLLKQGKLTWTMPSPTLSP
eukprot:TRINITY_DN19130_c0_g1_i4.p1 TRINITY_DN19130_c0_g1~~TRINITY_DN19130_c0_g1_i4.p1  ORF type:complete len:740 (-),score=128.07 TRINITY_DN19130_c0_g1_i4:1619-3838(-)